MSDPIELKWMSKPTMEYPDQKRYNVMPEGFDPDKQLSIEEGFFVFTMMPSLRCDLNCPHCYLSLDQRRNSPIMTLEGLEMACQKVEDYYAARPHIKTKMIICYWYGGEPTQMGIPYMVEAFRIIDRIMPESKGYYVRHEILTSLITVDEAWYDIFESWGRGHFQTSFDGLMRGKGYVKRWEKKVKEAISRGLSVSTISVVNNELIKDTPEDILDKLSELGIEEASFLPFMLNEQNQAESYEKFAPPMHEYSDFMIRLTSAWYDKKARGEHVPYIGQMSYIISRQGKPPGGNLPRQTMFLMPEGDFVLPDYKDGYLEFMKPFGNIFEQTFEEVLSSKSRRDYIRRQVTRNFNDECVKCEFRNSCIMEFWKENRKGDDCFGAKRYVQWLVETEKEKKGLLGEDPIMF